MGKRSILFAMICILLCGCSVQQSGSALTSDMSTESEISVEDQNYVDQNNIEKGLLDVIGIRRAAKCEYEDCPEIYQKIEQLLSDRTKVQFEIQSPDIDIYSDAVVEQDNSMFYPVKDESLDTTEEVIEKLLSIYDNEYIDKVLLPEYFDTEAPLYIERDGQLYARDVGVVILALQDDWSVWEVNENYYYVQAMTDTEGESLVILAVIREADGINFYIREEIEMEF